MYSSLSKRQEAWCVFRGRDVNLSLMGPHPHTVGKRKELVTVAGSRIRWSPPKLPRSVLTGLERNKGLCGWPDCCVEDI